MDEKILKILEDIYSVDGSLKAHEEALVRIIQKLLASKPESKIDENFISSLRVKLLESAKPLKEESPQKYMFDLSLMFKRIVFAGVSLAVILTVAFFGLKSGTIKTGNNALAIKNVGSNAFGNIVFSDQSKAQSQGQAENSQPLSSAPATADGRGTSQSTSIAAPIMGMGGGGGTTAPGMGIAYFPATYSYTGDKFEVMSDGLVYKRVIDNPSGSDLVNVINKMNLGLDLNKFGDLKVDSIQISEDKEFGYSLYIDFTQNTFSINQNWEKWPQFAGSNLTELPPDSQIIAISDKFLADYGIDMSKYGKGELMQSRIYYMAAMKGAAAPAADSMPMPVYSQYVSVVYPLVIGDQEVYDQGGQKYGLTVGVDLAQKRVVNVYNISTGSFESSKYDIETNAEKLIGIAEKGGLYGYNYYPAAENSLKIELGTPTQGLVVMWKYDGSKSSEMFVPSLIFPITSGQENYFYRNNVIVPLVGSMMDQSGGGIMPMPLETAPSK